MRGETFQPVSRRQIGIPALPQPSDRIAGEMPEHHAADISGRRLHPGSAKQRQLASHHRLELVQRIERLPLPRAALDAADKDGIDNR